MNLQMDPVGDLVTTRPLQTGGEIAIEPHPKWWFRFIDSQDRHFSNGAVPFRTRTLTDGPELLPTPVKSCNPPTELDIIIAVGVVQCDWNILLYNLS